ncbi:MAG: hypothetical protein QXF05_05175 [Thermofilaceae archaeon]
MRLWWLLLVLAALPLALAAPVCTAQDKCGSEVCDRDANCYWQQDRNCGTLFYCYAYTVGSYAIDTWRDYRHGSWPPQKVDDLNAWGMEAYLFTYTIGQGWYSYGRTDVWGLFENFIYGQTVAYVTYQIVGRHCNCQLNWEVSHTLSGNNRRVDAPRPPSSTVTLDQRWSTSSGAQSQVTVTACGSGSGWAAYRVQAGLFRVGVYIYGDVRSSGGSPSPPPSYTLTIQVLRATASGATSAPANGTRVRIGNTEYTADENGRVSVTLQQGSYSVEILTTYYGPQLTAGGQTTNWRRYRFWKWSDESTDNPRTVNLNSNTVLTAYVWDERALLVRWEPHFNGDAWGVLNATSGARFSYDSIVWLKRGQTVQLLSVEGSGMIFTYWRVGTECYRGQPYSSDPLLTLTVGDRGLSAIAVFRLAATNQTMLPPGAGMVNPVTYIPGATMGGEERMGRRGWWLMTVTHVPTGKTSPSEAGIDGRAWIYALIVNENGSSRWVPVTGVWRLQLAQDWDPSKHVKDLPGGVKIIEWNRSTIAGFPKILDPQEWREWYFVTLSAWDPLVYEELGGSYDTSGLWLANGSTLALYNVTFAYMGVNGDRVEYVYWQPIAVSTLTFRAEARYTLTEHEASLGRRRILMSIYVNATWKYVPPQHWQLLGFRVHAPQLGFLASLEEPGCTGTFCIGYWAPPSQAGATWRLYVIGLGDTEDFYSKAYPRGLLGGDGYSSVREFRISMRWLGAGNHPSTLIWGSDRVTFKLAPASVYKLEWTDPRGPFTVTWGCFAQGPWGLTPISSYTADLTFDWGVLGTNRSCANPARFNGVASPYTVNVQVPADNWIAFYVIPAGGRYEITQDGIVPVPLFAKYPPRG